MSAPSLVVPKLIQDDARRVLFLIPGSALGHSMVFARRQAAALVVQGFQVEMFDLRSRTSLRMVFEEFRRFRDTVRTFQPHVIHAHYGTVTAMFGALGPEEFLW